MKVTYIKNVDCMKETEHLKKKKDAPGHGSALYLELSTLTGEFIQENWGDGCASREGPQLVH